MRGSLLFSFVALAAPAPSFADSVTETIIGDFLSICIDGSGYPAAFDSGGYELVTDPEESERRGYFRYLPELDVAVGMSWRKEGICDVNSDAINPLIARQILHRELHLPFAPDRDTVRLGMRVSAWDNTGIPHVSNITLFEKVEAAGSSTILTGNIGRR